MAYFVRRDSMIPSLHGDVAFATREQAERVARLLNTLQPPAMPLHTVEEIPSAISPEEMKRAHADAR